MNWGKHSFLDSDFSGSLFLVTGNNITLDGDIAERAIVCNFDRITGHDPDFNPTQSDAFERASATAKRDVYTIVRAWAVAGCRRRTSRHTRSFPAGRRCTAGGRMARAARSGERQQRPEQRQVCLGDGPLPLGQLIRRDVFKTQDLFPRTSRATRKRATRWAPCRH